MKNILFLIVALFFSATSYSQILKPVKWSYATKKTGKNEAIIYLKATIDKGWHIYSQRVPEGGPVKTSFSFTPSSSYKKLGATLEPKPSTAFEKAFNMKVSYFSNTVVFQQKVNLSRLPAVVKGKIEYMACDDSRCLPPEEVDFSLTIK
ncbi:sugar transporter [Pelobium manganitolerans]|uniref:Sugar transporter n=1 Tax=Pelobium manganitolerans TaxID=1842495 RepID=A0A419S529_9SPHI|nr:protein-disulfide reductase DsbD domain-containing protein [Pelobium manganitolerans]RKD15177.1 sugar transporter [Pelobium manganitolerans]